MKTDIILCGVGGQGILSIATVIGEAATRSGLQLKQAEVHGMSQRGGDVQSNLRLSTSEIWSDLIPKGGADLIISMEPMEALRYVQYLAPGGAIVTSSTPLVNIPNYPDAAAVLAELAKYPNTVCIDIEDAARKAGNPKGANMVLLGAAARYLGIIGKYRLEEAIATVFASKGAEVVDANIRAFRYDLESV